MRGTDVRVTVERTTIGFRLTMPCGSREYVKNPDNDWWDRGFATTALDILENLYDVTRRNVRFEHLN